MEKNLKKIFIGSLPILAIFYFYHIINFSKNSIIKEIFKMASCLSYEQFSIIGIPLLLSVILTLKYILSHNYINYFYAPRRKIQLEKNDIGKLDVTFNIASNGNILEKSINKALEITSFDRKELPLWIKISKETIAKSYIMDEEKQFYNVRFLGKKSILKNFLKHLSNVLKNYERESILKIIDVNPSIDNWIASISTIKNLELPHNIKIKEENIPFNWILKILLSLGALISIVYLIMKILNRKIDKKKAIYIASKHLENIYGIKPSLKEIQEEKNSYTIIFNEYSVLIDKNSGQLLKVIKNEKV